jgi:large subunit ribosomal protein L24
MQKVLRRTALAKAQATRRKAARAAANAKDAQIIRRHNEGVIDQQVRQDIRDARTRRIEQRDLGALAPRWDVGEKKDSYGTLDSRRIRGKEIPREQRIQFHNIVEGDRVVIIEGRDKGRIGMVKTLNRETEEVTVKGLNMVRGAPYDTDCNRD